MTLKILRLKKGEDRRIRAGHPWIFSNEIDTGTTPLKSFTKGEEVTVLAYDKTPIGAAYINPNSLIAGRIFSRDVNQRLDQAFFEARITEALALRTRLFSSPYYRLVFSEADGMPGVVVDRFGTDLVVQLNSAGVELHKDNIAAALCAVLPDTTSILLRNDSSIRKHEGLETYVLPIHGTPPEEVTLEENGVRFTIPLLKGQKTGWFYDHRMNRARLQNYVVDRNVLDVFSYLGGWGIQAAVSGAAHVDCVESSAFAGEYIQKNAARNQVADKINVIVDDAFDAMKKLSQSGKQYDVIVLDPPAFVKKFKDRKEGLLAYQRVNELAIRLLTPGGILVTCSCSMLVSTEDLVGMLSRVAYRTQSTIQILERGHQGPDHPIHLSIPETDYLKAIFARKI